MDTRSRRFVNWLLGGGLIGWLASVIYPVLAYLKPPEQAEPTVSSVAAAKVDEVPVNSWRIIRFGRQPVGLQ